MGDDQYRLKAHAILILGLIASVPVPPAQGQGAPDIVWEQPTPSGLANSIQGVGWSPSPSGQLAFGSTDRWFRSRRTNDGSLIYSVLQPLHADAANQAIYSSDGAFIAVHNSGLGLDYRVHRA